MWVDDQLEGKGRHRVESRLVWAADRLDGEVELHGGGELTAEEAYVSERFGERRPTIANIAGNIRLRASIAFRLRLAGDSGHTAGVDVGGQ